MIEWIVLASLIAPAPDFYLDDYACYRYGYDHYECVSGAVHKICKQIDDTTLKCTANFIPCAGCEDT